MGLQATDALQIDPGGVSQTHKLVRAMYRAKCTATPGQSGVKVLPFTFMHCVPATHTYVMRRHGIQPSMSTGAPHAQSRPPRAPDEDGRERVALQVEQALREGGRAGLHAALVGGVDLEVVAVRAVQAQQPAAGRPVARVHHRAEHIAQRLGLRARAAGVAAWQCGTGAACSGTLEAGATGPPPPWPPAVPPARCTWRPCAYPGLRRP